MKRLLLLSSLIFGSNAYGAGYSNWAIPTSVELVKAGVLIHGEFGDPNGCGKPGFIYVAQSDPSYQSVLSISLAAFAAGKEIRAYANKCTAIGFHWAGEVINEHVSGQAFFIR